MIHSQIVYLIEAWGTTAKKWWSAVQVLQNQALRAIYGLAPRTPRLDMFKLAPKSIVPVKALYEKAVAKFIFEATHGLTVTNFNFEPGIGPNAIRNHKLKVPRTASRCADKNIRVTGPTIYNTFPVASRTATSLQQHKKISREYLRTRITNFLA